MAALATSREQDGTRVGMRQQFGDVRPGSRRAGRIRMLIKIYGGTRRLEARNLCETCRSSRIIRGRRTDEEVVFCSAMAMDPVRIEFKVTSCTDYVDARVPPYHELLEKAWVLTP